MKEIIGFQNEALNYFLEKLVNKANLELKVLLREHDRGMMFLLALFGDPEDLANKFLKKNKDKYTNIRPTVKKKADMK